MGILFSERFPEDCSDRACGYPPGKISLAERKAPLLSFHFNSYGVTTMYTSHLAVIGPDHVEKHGDVILPTLAIRPIVEGIARVLPKLILLLQGNAVRHHPIWGKLFPFSVSNYGRGNRSIGHCVGADLLITPEGVFVSEFDFAPSGRGFILASLHESGAQEVLQTFADWYKSMRLPEHPDDQLSYYYATGTRTSCWPETVYFCDRMRELGITIDPINMDELTERGAKVDRVIDRLFYLSELVSEKHLPACRIMTREPVLDSKMIAALIHDSNMTLPLIQALGNQDVAFLRRVVPLTYALDILRDSYTNVLDQVLQNSNRYNWLIKNTDVETDASWGCRGVVMGTNYTKTQFADALFNNVSPPNKNIGAHPVLQQFHKSTDFSPVWNGLVRGSIHSPNPRLFGREVDEQATGHCTNNHVYARVRPYFLVDATGKQVFIPPYAIATLRHNVLSHGATDALFAACAMN